MGASDLSIGDYATKQAQHLSSHDLDRPNKNVTAERGRGSFESTQIVREMLGQ